jgi:glycosyltransferase involved in cell wall biosynthesis
MACRYLTWPARAGAIQEIAGDAALVFDPHGHNELASMLLNVIGRADVREEMMGRGLAPAKRFTWDRRAAATLQVLREAAEG